MYDFIDKTLITGFYNNVDGGVAEYTEKFLNEEMPKIITNICRIKFIDPKYIDLKYCEILIRDYASWISKAKGNEEELKKRTQQYLGSLNKIILTKDENGRMINTETEIEFEKFGSRWYAMRRYGKELTNDDKILCKINGWTYK